MGMRESIQRLANSKIVPDYHWWEGVDLEEFAKEVLKDPKNTQVMVFEGLDEGGLPSLWLKPVPRGMSKAEALAFDGPEFNISHACPPLCP